MVITEQAAEDLTVITRAAGDGAKLDAIRDVYKSRFMQDSVLLMQTPVCAGF